MPKTLDTVQEAVEPKGRRRGRGVQGNREKGR